MTAADQLRREGEQTGLLRGKRSVLLWQLRVRFGLVTPEVEQQVMNADEPSLDTWTDRVLTAVSLEDVFGS